MAGFPLAQQVGDQIVPGGLLAELEPVEIALQCGLGGLGLAVGEGLLELAHVALALGGVARQAARELAHEGLGELPVLAPCAGNLVVELAVVVRGRSDPAHCELAQRFARDLRRIAERGHDHCLSGTNEEKPRRL